MKFSSLTFVVSVALVGSMVVACAAPSAGDVSSDEDVAATTQALRNCPGGVCPDPPDPPHSPPNPPPPPPPFSCNDTTHQIAPSIQDHNVYVCWNVTDCHVTPHIVYGPICNGYTLVSQTYCSSGLHMSCDFIAGTCRCR